MKNRRRKTIFVDIDGTLHRRGKANKKAIDFCQQKKAEGFDLVLWSARGREYATEFAQHFQLDELFSAIVSKPGYILDDVGWKWIKYTKVIGKI